MNATRRQSWLRLALVFAMALSWLGASVGCAFGLPCPRHTAVAKACPGCCDDSPAPETGKAGACCAMDAAPITGSMAAPMPPASVFLAWAELALRAGQAEIPAPILVADTGPPDDARSFAELILGRSRLEHAPPAQG